MKFVRQNGQSMVEFALVLPFLMLLIMGVFDFGRAVFIWTMLSGAAREGARYGAIQPTNSAGITAAVQSKIVAIDPAAVAVTISCDQGAFESPVAGGCAAARSGRDRIVVESRYEFHSIVPGITNLWPSLTVSFTSARTILGTGAGAPPGSQPPTFPPVVSSPTTQPAPTATPDPGSSPTATQVPTSPPGATATPLPTATATSTPSPTATGSRTPSPTATGSRTPSPTATPTGSSTPTATATATRTPTGTPPAGSTPTATPPAGSTPSATPPAGSTPVATATKTQVPPATSTRTPTPRATSTSTPVATATPRPTLHIGDLTDTSTGGDPRWTAEVEILVHNAEEGTVSNATVTGTWTVQGQSPTTVSCTTGAGGTCRVSITIHKNTSDTATFTVTNVSHASLAYQSSDNHDPDNDSTVAQIVVSRP